MPAELSAPCVIAKAFVGLAFVHGVECAWPAGAYVGAGGPCMLVERQGVENRGVRKRAEKRSSTLEEGRSEDVLRQQKGRGSGSQLAGPL